MVDLALEINEGIILQATDVERYGLKKLNLDEIILTNKNIICVYEKSNDPSSKSETVVEKIPLSTIRIVNNKVQVMIFDNKDSGEGLQVVFISGHREQFVFSKKSKNTMLIWINEINRILTGEPIQTEATVEDSPAQVVNKTTSKKKEAHEGFSIERRQEYVGKVLKCPNCGAVISERTAICPECGMEITGKVALSSVQAFKEQLMELESHRKKRFGGAILAMYGTADPVDKQIVTLIKNFPIPNSVDDYLEFMMFAIANIDVKLSKKSLMNSGQNCQLSAVTMPKAISDAWVLKMQQIYKKAEIIFPNDPVFEGMQKIYFDKMKELKIKVK